MIINLLRSGERNCGLAGSGVLFISCIFCIAAFTGCSFLYSYSVLEPDEKAVSAGIASSSINRHIYDNNLSRATSEVNYQINDSLKLTIGTCFPYRMIFAGTPMIPFFPVCLFNKPSSESLVLDIIFYSDDSTLQVNPLAVQFYDIATKRAIVVNYIEIIAAGDFCATKFPAIPLKKVKGSADCASFDPRIAVGIGQAVRYYLDIGTCDICEGVTVRVAENIIAGACIETDDIKLVKKRNLEYLPFPDFY